MGFLQSDLILTREGSKTCDLYLAAFLVTAGCQMKDPSRESKRVYFVFEHTEIIEKLKLDYLTRNTKVDALTYADNVKSLKSLCASILGNILPRG